MHGAWFLFLLLYLFVFVPYPRRLSSEELWVASIPPHASSHAGSIILQLHTVWIIVDDAVDDWVWVGFIVTSSGYQVCTLAKGTNTGTGLGRVEYFTMFYYVRASCISRWAGCSALFVDLVVWTAWDGHREEPR